MNRVIKTDDIEKNSWVSEILKNLDNHSNENLLKTFRDIENTIEKDKSKINVILDF